MSKLRVLDLFSGIGGFSLGLERTGGFETVAFCEIEEFPRQILAKHWPKVKCYNDVRELSARQLSNDGITVDVITGGFPCQDISTAGKQAGITPDTRSGLWSEIVRLADETKPRFILLENVSAIRSKNRLATLAWDLASIGYDMVFDFIPAHAVGSPQERLRVWIVAYPKEIGHRAWGATSNIFGKDEGSVGQMRTISFSTSEYQKNMAEGLRRKRENRWPSEPRVGRVADGVPNRVDRVGALGNSVVPQIPEMIGNAILSSMDKTLEE